MNENYRNCHKVNDFDIKLRKYLCWLSNKACSTRTWVSTRGRIKSIKSLGEGMPICCHSNGIASISQSHFTSSCVSGSATGFPLAFESPVPAPLIGDICMLSEKYDSASAVRKLWHVVNWFDAESDAGTYRSHSCYRFRLPSWILSWTRIFQW